MAASGACLRPEHSRIGLHGLLQVAADLRHGLAALRIPQLVQALDGVRASICRQVWLALAWLAILGCMAVIS